MQNPELNIPIWASLRALKPKHSPKIFALQSAWNFYETADDYVQLRKMFRGALSKSEIYDEILYRYFRRFSSKITIEHGFRISELAKTHAGLSSRHRFDSDLNGFGGFACVNYEGKKFVLRQFSINEKHAGLTTIVDPRAVDFANRVMLKSKFSNTEWGVEIERAAKIVEFHIKNKTLLEKMEK